MSPLPCNDCRKQGRCQRQWMMEREVFFSMADGRVVNCEEILLTWLAQLAA